jgi:ribosomal protein S18 acetylase RimI-like enzyme
MTTLKWRDRLLKADIDAIYQLVKKTGVFSNEECIVAKELAEERFARGLDSDYHFMLAMLGDELAAYTCYGRIPFTDNRFDLYWIASDPEASNKGIASQLLAISEAHMHELGAKKLYADTSSREVYVPAHRFYEKCGFMRESVFKDFYKDGDDKWVFVKNL